MTKKRLIVLFTLVVLGGLAFPVANLVAGLPHGAALGIAGQGSPEFVGASKALALKCANCHTEDYRLPFYASFPIAKGMIEADIHEGTEWLDLSAEFAAAPEQPVREVVLAKVEHTVRQKTMPPLKYLALHWNGALNAAEAKSVLEWIGRERAANYASAASTEALRASVLQPLPPAPTPNAVKVALGERLYNDGRLSKDGTISCASCHALDKGGTDRAPVSTGVGGAQGDINSPTVYNAGLQIAQFWDGRARDLQEQAAGPVENPVEMAESWPNVVEKLAKDEAFRAEFEAAYPEGLSKETVTDAIALFESTLITPDSAFDRYLLGDESALDADALAGHELFVSRGCAMCHVGMAMGGQSYERMGRTGDYFADRGDVGKADNGRFNVTGDEKDKHAFKVPLLRNVEVTGPYYHDGTVKTLEEATRLMGRYQLGLSLSDAEVKQLVAFQKSLTGTYKGEKLK